MIAAVRKLNRREREGGREGGQERDGESDGGRAGATELRIIPSFLKEDFGAAERSPGLIRVPIRDQFLFPIFLFCMENDF